MPAPEALHLLILGGTAEAAELARRADERFGGHIRITNSLAGRTERPTALIGALRIGGFGGTEGLAAYVAENAVDAVIDATHPFAATISSHAHEAAAAIGTPLLRLDRPPWPRHPLDRWIEVDDLPGAARALTRLGRRVWLTLGRSDLGAFAGLDRHWFLVRMIDRPPTSLPLAQYELLLSRGPFSLPEERLLIHRHGIEVPVIMITRPPPPPGPRVNDVDGALDWLAGLLDRPESGVLEFRRP